MLIWKSINARLALLEILSTGRLKRRHIQAEAYETLAETTWTRATGRLGEIGLVEGRRSEVEDLIGREWPEWRECRAELVAADLPATPQGHGRLRDLKRASCLPGLPGRINRRTAKSLTGPHSKAGLTVARRRALKQTVPTHDGCVRLRPPAGLSVRTGSGILDLSGIAAVLGEVSIPERAFLDGLTFKGEIRAALLVENLGPWRDLPAPPGWMLAHVPGWDTVAGRLLLDHLTTTPVVHFGDVDPAGVKIMRHLRKHAPGLKWFLPDFWFERLEEFGRRATWPADIDLDFAPTRVRNLVASGLWLEQERIVLDGRITQALEDVLAADNTACAG